MVCPGSASGARPSCWADSRTAYLSGIPMAHGPPGEAEHVESQARMERRARSHPPKLRRAMECVNNGFMG